MPARSADDVRIETYSGPRDNLRRLFELAEDSAAELDRVWLDRTVYQLVVYWSLDLRCGGKGRRGGRGRCAVGGQ